MPLEVFCVLAIVLLVVMVVGHAMWVAVAAVFKAVSGGAVAERGKACPKCGMPYGVLGGRCIACGAVPYVAPGRQTHREELRTTIGHLERLAQRGSIPQQQCDELVALLNAEINALTPSGGIRPAPQPVSAAAPGPGLVSAHRGLEVVEAVVVDAPPATPVEPPLVHPLDRPVIPAAPPPPRQPGKSLADMLQAFMEESNIRWGEILAAMLVVLCSVGLVISLRNTLQEIPYFPAILFTLFTVSFHGAGLYTLRRWKLHAVSRMILIISLLLVPLTFCGAITLSESRPTTDALFWVVLSVGAALFTWVAYSASREVVAGGAWPLALGVVGPSLGQVLVQHFPLEDGELWRLSAVLAAPLACFLTASGWQLMRAHMRRQLSLSRVLDILHVLGIAGFALLVLLAVLIVRVGPRQIVLARMSPLLSVAAASVLSLGLVIHRRTTARRLAAWQTAGTALAVLAAVVMLFLVAVTWSQPELLLVVALMNAAILAGLGIAAELPVLYVPSAACAAIFVTIGMHLVGGHFADRTQLALKLVQAGLMGRTAVALGLVAAAIGGLAGWRKSLGRAEEALMLLVSSGELAVIGLLIAVFSGFVVVRDWPQDRDLSAGVLLAFSVSLIAAGPMLRRAGVAGLGSVVLWMALLQALGHNATVRGWLAGSQWLIERPLLAATVLHGATTAFTTLVASGRVALAAAKNFLGLQSAARQQYLAQPLAIGAAVSLAISLPLVLWVRGNSFSTNAALAAAAAAAWAMLAAAQRWRWAVSGMQAMAAVAAALWIAGAWHARTGGRDWLANEQHLFAQCIALALAAIVWSAARRHVRGRVVLREMLHAPWPAVDQVLLGLATAAVLLIGLWIALPLIGWELGFGNERPVVAAGVDAWGTLGRGWIAVTAIAAALLVSLYERVTFPALVGLGIASFAGVWLAAAHFEESVAVASGARWAAAIYAVVWAALYIARTPLHRLAKSLPPLRWAEIPKDAAVWLGGQPLVLGGTTILALTITAVMQDASGIALRGPAAGLFADLGPTISYAGPLGALVAILLGYALREREAGFALGGAAVAQLAVNVAFILNRDATATQAAQAVQWLQWNALAAACYALVWQSLAPWITPTGSPLTKKRIAEALWLIPAAIAGLAVIVLVGAAALAIFDEPNGPVKELVLIGSWPSYVAIGLLALAVAWWVIASARAPHMGELLTWSAAGLAPLIAASLHRYDAGGQWLAYHTLQVGWLTVSFLACAVICWRATWSVTTAIRLNSIAPHHLSAAAIGLLVVVLALRGHWFDPAEPWWSLGTTFGALAVFSGLGLARRSQPYAYTATVLVGLIVILVWTSPTIEPAITFLFGSRVFAGIECLVLAVTLAAGFWLTVEIAYQRRTGQSFDVRTIIPGVQITTIPGMHVTTIASLLPLYCIYRLTRVLFHERFVGLHVNDIIATFATAGFGGLIVGCLWDRRALFALRAIYWWGFAAAWLVIGLCGRWLPTNEARLVAITLAAAGQIAISGQLWSNGANLAAWGARLGISDPVAGLVRTERWLPPLTAVLTALVCLACLVFVNSLDELPLRAAAGFGPAVAAWGVLCLAQGRRRDSLQLAALLLAGLSAIYLAWAQIRPQEPAVWMTRVFRLLMVLAALTCVYGLVLPRLLLTSGSWNAATRKAGYVASVAALAAFALTLALEVQLYMAGQQGQIDGLQVAAIAAVLLGLIAGLVSLAVLPGRDPLVLSEEGRQGYVYAAEAVAALLFAHLFVCRPEWFSGIFRQYWPFIVMGIAFAGVGAAEYFSRRNVRVLAELLVRTGALLPLLPVLGWWVVGSEVDYSLLLLIVGILYLALSYTRRSWAAMVAATVAGNGALWALLADTNLRFLTHPQLWMIPPALSVLVAAQLNRRRLTPETLATIRYAATGVIYVSSTSEIFIRGIGAGIAPPMILLGLAVAGAMAGIALQVRAFLILGSAFTFLALVTMVRHAAQSINNVWPWWVFGIALGVLFFVLRGILESKREEVTLLIARLRQWES